MAVLVREILKQRLTRLNKAEMDEDVLNAYFDHKMDEHDVDQDNPKVIKAIRAYLDFLEHRDSLQTESITAFAEGRRDVAAKIEEVDFQFLFEETMRKHDVDFDDREVGNALQAVSEVDNRMTELKINHVQEMKDAFRLYSAFQPRSRKIPPDSKD